MDNIFTDYVRQLTGTGEPPDRASYDEACEHLRAVLVTELRRRGLWNAPPRHVGVLARSWRERDALDELVSDAYVYLFLDRLKSLIDQARVRDSIDGLVVWHVRHFLTKRQRQADPLGYRIYLRLRAAVEKLLECGRLFIHGLTGGDNGKNGGKGGRNSTPPKVHNASVLAFSQRPTAVADIRQLEGPVAEWNNHLMPDLVLANRRGVPQVVERLSGEMAGLPGHGVSAFRFQHLAKALKDDARQRWQALWDTDRDTAPEDAEPGAEVVPISRPDETPDLPRFRAKVLECVEHAIAVVRQPKRQRDLWTVWTFLRSARLDTDQPSELPSHSETGRLLGLPRIRVSQILDQLKELVLRCFDCPGLGAACACASATNDDSTAEATQGEILAEQRTR